jgi:hypothetical protein
MKIVTEYRPKPVPVRNMDWIATYEGDDPERQRTGFGSTETEAVENLKENHPLTEERVMDAYDKMVAYLNANPHLIFVSWNDPRPGINAAGPLFAYVWPHNNPPGKIGCLTTIATGEYDAATPELKNALLADDRLKVDVLEIRYDAFKEANDERAANRAVAEALLPLLPVFAEWQRRIDKELGRNEPLFLGPNIFLQERTDNGENQKEQHRDEVPG